MVVKTQQQSGKKVLARTALPKPERLSSVPSPDVAARYVGRKFGPHTEMDIFAYAMANNINVLIEGPTGPGKTTAVMAYGASEGLHFYAIPSNIGLEPSQLFGKYIPNPDPEIGGFVWQDGPVTDIVRHGGILLLNEVNFMPPRVATVLFGLLDARREITLLDHKGEVVPAHKDLLVVADMNPDYVGTQTLNAAFRNRFAIQLEWGYDRKVESKLVKSDTLLNLAQKMRQQQANGTLNTPVSTNMLIEFEKMVEDLGMDFALANFVAHFDTEDRPAVTQVFKTAREELNKSYAAPKPQAVSGGDGGSSTDDWDFVDGSATDWIFGNEG